MSSRHGRASPLFSPAGTGITLDLDCMDALEVPGRQRLDEALRAMAQLEAGALANLDEKRQVGHYWLRDPDLAPTDTQAESIREAVERCESTARALLRRFQPTAVLHLGIGGSALGPRLLLEALGDTRPDTGVPARSYRVLDNTDPNGFCGHLATVDLERSLVVVVSKSGGTVETRNALLTVRRAFDEAGVAFAARALAVTGDGSELHRLATREGWAAVLPLWDYVGGRTSVTGPVGLLPAALLGISGRELLEGASAMDAATRLPVDDNPAACLAAVWLAAQEDRPRAMVVLPYADRLQSLARYLQQLIMESVGKKRDRAGNVVRHGLTVYGNKGSTDQHAFVQQLRDGPDDFFCTFVQVLCPGAADPVLENGVTAGDALAGFLEGTRQALEQDGKRTLTIAVDRVNPRSLGALIALFERAVGIYAELVNINAYHQPGVEAGKKAAARVLDAQRALVAVLGDVPESADSIADKAGVGDPGLAWRILRRLAACPGRGVRRLAGDEPGEDLFGAG